MVDQSCKYAFPSTRPNGDEVVYCHADIRSQRAGEYFCDSNCHEECNWFYLQADVDWAHKENKKVLENKVP